MKRACATGRWYRLSHYLIPCLYLIMASRILYIFWCSFLGCSMIRSQHFCAVTFCGSKVLILKNKSSMGYSSALHIFSRLSIVRFFSPRSTCPIYVGCSPAFSDVKADNIQDAKRQVKMKVAEYSCAMKSHFREFGNQMSGSGNHLCNYASLLA